MSSKKDKLSVFISLILRHKPEVIGIKLDSEGYADTNELLEGVNKSGRYITLDMLKDIVATDKKGRYSFNSDFSKIRANQGHSVKVDVGLKELKPPKYLYHGTASKNIQSIMDRGISKMNRLYVHLSDNKDTAIQVGRRHGLPTLLKIDAIKMYEEGHKFYRSENGVWLVDFVDVKYIKELIM